MSHLKSKLFSSLARLVAQPEREMAPQNKTTAEDTEHQRKTRTLDNTQKPECPVDHEADSSVPRDAPQEVEAMVEEASPSPGSMTVRKFIRTQSTSVRLHNIAVSQEFFAQWTVGDTCSSSGEFAAQLKDVRGLGSKTREELQKLLENHSPLPSLPFEPRSEEKFSLLLKGFWADKEVREILETLSIDMILIFVGISTRLQNALPRADLVDLTLDMHLEDPAILRHRLQKIQGLGSKSIDEAIVTVEQFIEAAANEDVTVATLLQAENPDWSHPVLDGSSHDLVSGDTHPLSPLDRFRRLVDSLSDNEKNVLEQRYGLIDGQRHTLQEVADGVNVTRERIRQIQAKALRRLKAPINLTTLLEFLKAENDTIWTTLSVASGHVDSDALAAKLKSLSPWQSLAIEITSGDLKGYLDATGTRIASGWVRNGIDADQVRNVASILEDFSNNHPTPVPLSTILNEIYLDPADIRIAIKGSSELSLVEGYLCEGRSGVQMRRTLHLHRIAKADGFGALLDIATLTNAYRLAFPKDNVASRMYRMQMEQAPHLFCRLFDNIWYALPTGHETVPHTAFVPFESEAGFEEGFEGGSIGAAIVRLLEKGPQRHVDLRQGILERFSGRVAESSIGAILLSNPCFRRVAPGVFDLYKPKHSALEQSPPCDVLLNDRQCREYCIARHGGAPADWYPAWGVDYEMHLARWAKKWAEDALFRSLLSVVEPASWPVQPDEQAEWQHRKANHGAWMIGSSRRHRLGHRLVEPHLFLATLAQLAWFGWTSWVAVNRTTDVKSDFHNAADTLSMLVASGLAECPTDWQARHAATQKVHSVFADACQEMHLNGQLSWENGVLEKLMDQLETDARIPAKGWFDLEEFAHGLAAWQSGEARTTGAFAPRLSEPIDPEPIFETDEWDSLFTE